MKPYTYDNLPNPPLSERAIETAALIETRTGDEGELYRRWVAIQIDEARRDAFIGCETEMEKLRDALSACAEESDMRNVRGIVARVLLPNNQDLTRP